MSNVGVFVVVLTLFAVKGLAKPSIDQVLDWRMADNNGRPSTSGTQSECIKDILLVVDTSLSIGRTSFNRDIKPFLKQLVDDTTLNVGPDGTQIAMIIFSHEKKTRTYFNFGQHLTKQALMETFDAMNWDNVKGGHTRTDLALEIANNEVFTKMSPLNNRPEIDDVVIIITDGEPRGAPLTEENAYRYAGDLKDKDILVICAAVGPSRMTFLDKLQKMATSEKYTVEADFNKMDEILARLVASSCTKPGQCICGLTNSAPIYVKPGNSKASVSWPKPAYECWSGRAAQEESFSVDPPITPPHEFSVGKHTINYTFKLKGGVEVVCPVSLEVKGELCRGVAFSSKTQACCCGTILERKDGYDCCGPDYYNTLNERCCPNANRLSREESCPTRV